MEDKARLNKLYMVKDTLEEAVLKVPQILMGSTGYEFLNGVFDDLSEAITILDEMIEKERS